MTAHRTVLHHICQSYQIAIMYAFGSRATAVAHWLETGTPLEPSPSDVDIGVLTLPHHTLNITEKVKLAIELDTLWDVPVVDLVSLREADAFLAVNIIRGERLYANDTVLADEYDLYILRRAADLIPFERERQRLIMNNYPTSTPPVGLTNEPS